MLLTWRITCCNLVPRPFPPPVFHRFSSMKYGVLEAMKYWQWEWPGNEATPAESRFFSLELNISLRVKSESSCIFCKSLGKSQPGSSKPVVFCENSRPVNLGAYPEIPIPIYRPHQLP